MKNILIYCRPGFEKDALAEITDKAAECGIYGYGVPQESSGFIVFNTDQQDAAETIIRSLSFNHLIFARQIVAVNDVVDFEQGGRVQALLEAARDLPLAEDIWLETADTNEAKALAGLIKKIQKEKFLPLDMIKRIIDSGESTDDHAEMGGAIFKSHKVPDLEKKVKASMMHQRHLQQNWQRLLINISEVEKLKVQ
mgnify:CR=1 FL=1